MRHIIQCRTAALGGHLEQCDACGYQRISFHSCRDRHCPKCQSLARQDWLEKRLATLLPIPYFHIVFTIPHELNALALGNQTILFNILFASVAQTLQQVAATPRHLGAEIGFTAVLHTWGQNMMFHPHLHCVVTGGGLSPDHKSWIAAREKFFLPIPVLRLLFRGKFLAALRQAYVAGQLKLAGSTATLNQPSAWRQLVDPLYKKDWVVYAKAPFASPEYVFRYLGRYTHRVAISNHRILAVDKGQVTFTLKNYAAGGKHEQSTVEAVEFIRRFLLHVLPQGFSRIRHFGLCAGRNVQTKLPMARAVLTPLPPVAPQPPTSTSTADAEKDSRPWWQRLLDRTGIDVLACPCCGRGRLVHCGEVQPLNSSAPNGPPTGPRPNDSS